jgi:5-methylcytosine-specific restriction endonuclease McrA
MPMARPCIDCNRPTTGTRCPDCAAGRTRPRRRNGFYQSPEWRRLSKAARDRDQGECALCGSTNRVQAHHRVHRKEGGPDTLENLVSLCARCHRAAHSRPSVDRFIKGGDPHADQGNR